MTMASCVFMLLASFVLAFEFGFCLECHHCTTMKSGNACKKPKDDRFLIDCALLDSYNFNVQNVLPYAPNLQDGVAGAERYCHKVVAKGGHILRSCLDTYPSNMHTTCDLLNSDPEASSKILSCNVCDSPGCNESSGLAGSLALVSIVLFMVCLN